MRANVTITSLAGKRARCFTKVCGWLAVALMFGGGMQAADLPPENVFAWPPALPPELKRVVLLPIAADAPDANLSAGCESLQSVLFDELVRTEKFEVVSVRPEHLRASSGRTRWTGTEKLPKEFFDSLQREYSCDAVLFCELTGYHAYAPLSIGWRLKLVNASTHEIIWAADQAYDANQPETAQKALKFLINRSPSGKKEEIRWRSLNSPRQFGSYTAAAILSRLPAR